MQPENHNKEKSNQDEEKKVEKKLSDEILSDEKLSGEFSDEELSDKKPSEKPSENLSEQFSEEKGEKEQKEQKEEKKPSNDFVRKITEEKYKYGFTTDVHTEVIEQGLNENVVRLISSKKNEPEWLLEFRLKAYRHWLTMEMPTWAHLRIPEIDYQGISYYADPLAKKKDAPKSMDEVDPELINTFNKLGIPLEERMALSGMAVDAVMDSVSVKTTFKETLMEKGIIFCSISEAVREHPDLVQKYLGSVVGYRDNFFAALNSAVFSDGSFVYIPKGVRCPMELSTY